MRKIYVGALALLSVSVATAQVNTVAKAPLTKKNSELVGSVSKAKPEASEKISLWSDDFSTPSNWTIVNTGANPAGWEFSTNPADIPVSALAPMASTTAANGYLFVNSDANNSADFDGFPIVTTATSQVIDLTGNPFVQLKYEHNFRWWHDTRGVRVSGDNGATWTDFEMSNESDYSTPNQNSGNPEVTVINISAVAGGSNQVLVQFYYDDNDYWGWYWAVDDVEIMTLDDYDLQAQDVYWGSVGSWGVPLPYGMVPVSQIAPIDFGGVVFNNGINDVSDLTFTADIPSVYNSSTAASFLAANTQDTFYVASAWTPAAATSVNTIDFSVTTANVEDNTANNAFASETVEITNYVYARDMGVIENGTFNSGDEFESGNIFDIYATDDIYGANITISASSNVGAQVYAKLYSIDAATGDFIYVAETDAHEITAADLGAEISLMFFGAPHTLNADEPYLVVAATYGDGGLTNDVVVATSGTSEAQTTYYYDGTDATWYYSTNTPMVRMNFDPAMGISETAELTGVAIYPNPSTGVINITNDNNVNNTINVYTLAGNEVASKVASTATTIDLSAMGAGVYLVEVANENGKKVERVVIR